MISAKIVITTLQTAPRRSFKVIFVSLIIASSDPVSGPFKQNALLWQINTNDFESKNTKVMSVTIARRRQCPNIGINGCEKLYT